MKSDYTGLEIKDADKVKVTFEEAKNDKDEDFTTDHADTYKAVYYVEPVNQEHPKYQISRNLIAVSYTHLPGKLRTFLKTQTSFICSIRLLETGRFWQNS